MNKSFGLLFYVKRSKMNDDGFAPIYLRISLDCARTEISCKRYVTPDQWNISRGKVTGTSEEVRSVNAYLKTLEHEVCEVYRTMIENKLPLTVATLKNQLLGNNGTTKLKTLVPIFEEHNRQTKALVGKEYSKATYDRYETSLKHTQAFCCGNTRQQIKQVGSSTNPNLFHHKQDLGRVDLLSPKVYLLIPRLLSLP